MNYIFILRKDNVIRNQLRNIQSLNTNLLITNNNSAIQSRQINDTISKVNTIDTELNNKVNIEDLPTSIIKTIENDTFIETKINDNLELVINSINAEKQKVLNEINIHQYNAINNINNGIGNSNIYARKNELDIINDNLVKKIDYLFKMFYHADSNTIINNFPLVNNN